MLLIFCRLRCFSRGIYYLIGEYSVFLEWEVVTFNSVSIVFSILLDWIRLIFISFVLFISSLVVIYSREYISGDKNINRFIMLVLLFVCSIMLLIISPNIVRILLGWDGLGLVSYCLVIYFQNVKSFNAGILTALSNRIGDVAFLIAIAWILNYGSWNYVFYLEINKIDSIIQVIGVLIVLAALTKSAQIPFSSWLPAAMAAPTPVSALVHSSTLVTAGVYLLIRFNILISGRLGSFLLIISGLTIFIAGIGANFEFDLKKIIALSTLSQLGLIIRILGIGWEKLAFFHLLTHALFKALLFICAGRVIHNMGNSQDIRTIGGLTMRMPLTVRIFRVANLALCGMPFLAGFYSKDIILEVVSLREVNIVRFMLYFLSTGLTVCYSFRLVYYLGINEAGFMGLNILNDEGWCMVRRIIRLLIISILGGRILNWLIFPTPLIICLPFFLKILTLVVCLLGGLMGFFFCLISLDYDIKSLKFFSFTYFLGRIWYMPYISTVVITEDTFKYGQRVYESLDQGWSEFFGCNKIGKSFIVYAQWIQFLQLNNLKIYLLRVLLIIITIIIFIIYLNSLIEEYNIEDVGVAFSLLVS